MDFANESPSLSWENRFNFSRVNLLIKFNFDSMMRQSGNIHYKNICLVSFLFLRLMTSSTMYSAGNNENMFIYKKRTCFHISLRDVQIACVADTTRSNLNIDSILFFHVSG